MLVRFPTCLYIPILSTQDACQRKQERVNPSSATSIQAGQVTAQSLNLFSPAKKELLPSWQELWGLEEKCVKCPACAWQEASPQRIIASVTGVISMGGINRMWSLMGYEKGGRQIRPMF